MLSDFSDLSTSSDLITLIIIGVIAFVLVFAITAGIIIYMRRPSDDRKIEKMIKELGDDYARDVVLPDGIYGYHFIDYLILMGDKIIVLGVEDWDGYIFGGDNIEQWTRVRDQKSVQFDNPIMNNSHYIQSIENFVSGLDIIGKVAFTSTSSFPKGKPEGVIEMSSLRSELELYSTKQVGSKESEINHTIKSIWEQVLNTVNEHKQNYKNELAA